MASLQAHTVVLGHRLATHLLRRTTYIQKKELIDEFAAYTLQQAMIQLFEILAHHRPEPEIIQITQRKILLPLPKY